MDKNKYPFANLNDQDLQHVNQLEKKLSEEKGEEVILIAYEDDNNQ